MLTWLRNNAKIFLIIVVVTFVLLVFVDWGSGRDRSASRQSLAVARVGDIELTPYQYQEYYRNTRNRFLNNLQMTGNPDPEGEIAALHYKLEETAFEEMINSLLRYEFLNQGNWPALDLEDAEAIINFQFRLSGISNPDSVLALYRDDPRYIQQILAPAYQNATSIMFPAAVRSRNMAPNRYLTMYIEEHYTPITARYVVFRGNMRIPSDDELEQFYEENPDLFTDPASALVHYITIIIEPLPEDDLLSRSVVDSLVLVSASSDSIVFIRRQLLGLSESLVDLQQGETSELFRSPSITTAPGLNAWHAVRIDSVLSSSGTGLDTMDDTIHISHWEYPIFPGIQAIRETFWNVESETRSILDMIEPQSSSFTIADAGIMTIYEGYPPVMGFPEAFNTFALDTMWVDSIGPVLYLPSYSGGYPAFLITKRLEYNNGGLLTLNEARENGRLLLTASTHIQKQGSIDMANQALTIIENGGYTLGFYAEAESLDLLITPEFSVAAVREAARNDPEASGGILFSSELADIALFTPPFETFGPIIIGNNAALIEITSRPSAPIPDDPMILAPLYLSLQAEHGVSAVKSQLVILRNEFEVVDLREEFFAQTEARTDSLAALEEQQQDGSQE